ncbi:AAA family ATPase [Pseudomonas sp. PCH199]|uniref:LuxR C-terminal-related transcriptional regulator n=1 Tax=unclassified Pseudomonas TaxID=196821 RepID=UPI000BCB36A1|nr:MULTISPECIES: LuxR C-terminal-related transcriptional regulator [unclassified Pseudomonas]MCW8279202.1 AAA family ATPase [Pseudomonas sp. PCH199]PAM78526.1 plasmid partition protein [Pseudomonas sp. ERMR1:02]
MKPNTLLVSTKFAPPRLSSQAVMRQELMGRLFDARQKKLIVITGGAGFGKTTLMAQWRMELIKDKARVSWLSLTPEDSSRTTFCIGLIGTLQKAGLVLENDLWLLSDAGESGWHQAMCAAVINALDQDGTEQYLMVDDFHHASDPDIVMLVQALVDAAPENLHIVLASRVAPTLLLGRLRAMGELCEIDGSELSFAFRESFSFLKNHLDASIDLDSAHSIHDLTKGWAIGLQLVSIAMKAKPGKQPQPGRQLLNSANLSAYLSEDVISDLPDGLIQFMQKISILRRFNSSLATHLTESERAPELIAVIEARNLFLLPVDMEDRYQWYRLHPMFAEFLIKRLDNSSVDVARLHLRAAQWFADEGLFTEAVRHAVLSGEFHTVVEILERAIPTLTNLNHLGVFMRWIQRVPTELLSQHPRLLLMGAWSAVMVGHLDTAREWQSILAKSQATEYQALQTKLLQAMIFEMDEDVENALVHMEEIGDAPLGHAFFECFRLGLTVGSLAVLGHYAQARSRFNTLADHLVLNNTSEVALINRSVIGVVALYEGNVLESERICSDILCEAETQHGRRSLSASSTAALLSEIWYELDRIDDARETLANRLDMLHFSAPEYMYCAARSFTRLQYLQEGVRCSLDYAAKKEAHFRTQGLSHGVALMLAEQVNLVLKTGDWRHGDSLQALLDDLAQKPVASPSCHSLIGAAAALSRARLALAKHKPEEALSAIETAHEIATRLNRGVSVVKADILKAVVLDRLGDDGASRSSLMTALASGYRLGLVRTFLDEGDLLHRLLTDLDCHAVEALAQYQQQLLARLKFTMVATDKPSLPLTGPHDDTEPLTKREQEILALLEQSMSNKHIALALNISVQTVKWNLKNMFIKLGVSSRYEAIIVARKRG